MAKIIKIDSAKAWKARQSREKSQAREQQRRVDEMLAWFRQYRAKVARTA